MDTVLSALGVTPDGEALYRSVLRQADCTVTEHSAVLGWTQERTRAGARTLLDLGLVHERAESRLRAAPPQSTLRELLEREAMRLTRRRRQLDDASLAVTQLVGQLTTDPAMASQPASAQIISRDRLSEIATGLLRGSTGPIRSVHLQVQGPVGESGLGERALAALESGRELRTLYPISVVDRPEPLEWMRQWHQLGELQRMAEIMPEEFTIFGRTAVLARRPWGESRGATVELREPASVAAFMSIFDRAWADALPTPGQQGDYRINDRLLALLANGLKDEVIARYLGLGVRTVRRRIAELMVQLQVQTRFQLGAVAQRRGLLRPPHEPSARS
jgi:DNA-binding CsgD family transcriptional regulator